MSAFNYQSLLGRSDVDIDDLNTNSIQTNNLKIPTNADVDDVLTCVNADGTAEWRPSVNLTGVTTAALKLTGGAIYDVLMNTGAGVMAWTQSLSLSSLLVNFNFTLSPTTAVADKIWTCKDATGLGEWRDPATATLAGDVSGLSNANVVDLVGGSTAGDVHNAELLANASTSVNTASTIVKRDVSGDFSAGTITADVIGDVTGSSTAMRNGSTWVVPYSGVAPTTNDVLSYNGTNAVWTAPAVPSVTMGGDVTGSSSACTVVSAAGNFNVVGRTTTAGETNTLGLNFTTPNIKMLALTDSGTTTILTQHNFDGLGSDTNIVRYQAKAKTTRHVFFAATSSTTSDTLMTVRGDGVVEVPKILSMTQTLRRKMICLHEGGISTDENGTKFYGFGVIAGVGQGILAYNVLDALDSHVFYAGTSPGFVTKLMEIKDALVTVPADLSVGYGGYGNYGVDAKGRVKSYTSHTHTWQNPTDQGTWISWNRVIGSGRTAFACQQGGGAGGFEWLNYDSTNTLTTPNPLMTLDSSGNLLVGLDNDVTQSGSWGAPMATAGTIEYKRRNNIIYVTINTTSLVTGGGTSAQPQWSTTVPSWARPPTYDVRIPVQMVINGQYYMGAVNIPSLSFMLPTLFGHQNPTFSGNCGIARSSGSYVV